MERRGWVTSPEERERIEADVRRMSGQAFAAVRYVGMAGDPAGEWDAGTFHSLDYGLEIELHDGTTWSIVWDQAGHNEGLLVDSAPMSSQVRPDGMEVWDVTPIWQKHFPSGIGEIEFAWTRHVWNGEKSDLCLFTMKLGGAGDSQAVVAFGGAGFDEQMRYTPFSHDVSVFFDVDEARRAGVLLPGDPDAIT